jgi:hypothetical protein
MSDAKEFWLETMLGSLKIGVFFGFEVEED